MFWTTAMIRAKIAQNISLRDDDSQIKFIQTIAKRFANSHTIDLLHHVQLITKVGHTITEGFHFRPVSVTTWENKLKASKKFDPDDRDTIIGCIASWVTNGTGYREIGQGESKSLHCAVASNVCSIHLDNTAFKSKGPFGFYTNLDALQHVIYDLGWDDKVVRPGYNKNYYLGKALDLIRPTFLNSTNKYSKYGVGLDFIDRPNLKVQFDYTRSFNLKKNLNNNFYKGFSNPKEQRFMLNAEGTHDWLSG